LRSLLCVPHHLLSIKRDFVHLFQDPPPFSMDLLLCGSPPRPFHANSFSSHFTPILPSMCASRSFFPRSSVTGPRCAYDLFKLVFSVSPLTCKAVIWQEDYAPPSSHVHLSKLGKFKPDAHGLSPQRHQTNYFGLLRGTLTHPVSFLPGSLPSLPFKIALCKLSLGQ